MLQLVPMFQYQQPQQMVLSQRTPHQKSLITMPLLGGQTRVLVHGFRLDLGRSQKTVCSVDISRFNGNQRVNTFEIAVSNDGNTFTKIFSSKSSGTTTAAEKYDVPDSQRKICEDYCYR